MFVFKWRATWLATIDVPPWCGSRPSDMSELEFEIARNSAAKNSSNFKKLQIRTLQIRANKISPISQPYFQ